MFELNIPLLLLEISFTPDRENNPPLLFIRKFSLIWVGVFLRTGNQVKTGFSRSLNMGWGLFLRRVLLEDPV